MNILSIDTSFDDTAVSMTDGNRVLSNVLSTELAVHLEYGGVVPRLARVSHEKNLDRVIALSLKRARMTWQSIDAVAVTVGPGLAICLEIGIAKAKEMAKLHKKPLIPVNHMEGHLLSFLANRTDQISFPFLGVLVSGGHTQFVLCPKIGSYEIVGETKDDAMGEAYDKVGRMLGLGYPAGAVVEKIAQEGREASVIFPVPMRQIKSSETSFSGLKTAAMRIVENAGALDRQKTADIAAGFQTASITHLSEKLAFALAQNPSVCALVVGGGVAKNTALRRAIRKLGKEKKLAVYFPNSGKLCTDNAAMIGIAAQFSKLATFDYDVAIFDRKPTWRLESASL